ERVFDGILDRQDANDVVAKLKTVKNPQEHFLFFDFNRAFKFADQLKGLGFHGNFPTEEDRLFEIDREKAKAFVREWYPHLKVAESHEFKTVAEGISFLERSDLLWVLKSFSEDGAEHSLTVLPTSTDPEAASTQLIEALNEDRPIYEKAGFL